MEFQKEISKYVSVQKIIKDLKLDCKTKNYQNNKIITQSIYRIGYELSGFFLNGEELNTHLNVLGRKEAVYLEKQPKEKREKIINEYMKFSFPMLVITCETPLIDEIVEIAEKYEKPVATTGNRTTEFIRNAKFYLQRILAKEIIENNYILLDIYGVGILITGYDDAKLGATIELLERGHKFITDTRLKLKSISGRFLMGYNTAKKTKVDNHYYLFGKDGNDIDVTSHFGIKSTRGRKRITLLVELEKWDEKKFYDRLGLDEKYTQILDINIPTVTLPVRKGRNLAVIIETAAMNYRLKKTGINSAEYFWNQSREIIEENKLSRLRGDSLDKKANLPMSEFIEKFNLKVLSGDELIPIKYVETTGIHRPSLALLGYFDMYEQEGYKGIQLFTEIEFKYLENLSKKERIQNLEKYLDNEFPGILVSKMKKIPEYFLEVARRKKILLLETEIEKASQVIAIYTAYLENYFAPWVSKHGVFVELYGFGVLLTGRSGIGKSEIALELIHRGHRLIADDSVRLEKSVLGDITGMASKLPYFMEIRGLGIIDVKALYGIGAVRISKRLDAIIELKELKSEDYSTSMEHQEMYEEILENRVPKLKLHISSGRNAAAMVEIAVMNMIAKKMGHNSEMIYKDELKKYKEG